MVSLYLMFILNCIISFNFLSSISCLTKMPLKWGHCKLYSLLHPQLLALLLIVCPYCA